MPVGPWVLVVGMHRSGTSAVTGALGQLGMAVPVEQDRFEPSEDNPDHWESRAIGFLDDVLLERLGGTWDRPPDADIDWESDPDLALDRLDHPAEAATAAFPSAGPVVFKDPRSCLLLRYWLAYIPKPVAAVFIWRSPVAVAHSLRTRDGLHLADGIALWERYNRSGLADLVGIDTYVTRYESIMEDPLRRLGELATWLGELPQFAAHAPHWDVASAAASISKQLLRQRDDNDEDLLLDEQRRLVEHLHSIEGPHRPLTSFPPGAESPWTSALLGDRHELTTLSRQRDALKRTLAEQKVAADALAHELVQTEADLAVVYELYEGMRASTSWRVTRPLRQVVTFGGRRGTTPGE
jgi:hypothetical protein